MIHENLEVNMSTVNPEGYLKKDKVYYIVVAALIIGFVGGTIYSKYISPPRYTGHTPRPSC